MVDWIYEGKPLDYIPNNKYGFVYLIEYDDGTKYIGKKSFYSFTTKPPLKNYKRKRKLIRESNWRTYNGSCKQAVGKNIVYKQVLFLCNSKRHLTYMEEYFLFCNYVLDSDDWLNSNIAGRHFDNYKNTEGEYLKYKGD